MKSAKTVIQRSQGGRGWIIYFDDKPDNFHVFKSNELEAMVEFLTEEVFSINFDALFDYRQREKQKVNEILNKQEKVNVE